MRNSDSQRYEFQIVNTVIAISLISHVHVKNIYNSFSTLHLGAIIIIYTLLSAAKHF